MLFALAMPIDVFFYPLVLGFGGVLLRLLIANIQHSA
jgi:hypothetical protein